MVEILEILERDWIEVRFSENYSYRIGFDLYKDHFVLHWFTHMSSSEFLGFLKTLFFKHAELSNLQIIWKFPGGDSRLLKFSDLEGYRKDLDEKCRFLVIKNHKFTIFWLYERVSKNNLIAISTRQKSLPNFFAETYIKTGSHIDHEILNYLKDVYNTYKEEIK